MQIITTVAEMQRWALRQKKKKTSLGFVPTMGYLHAGHMSLVSTAREFLPAKSKVVVSIYVNPTQFGPTEDFSKYPRDLKRDLALCRKAGVDVVFTPSDCQIYPGRSESLYSTYVVEEQLGTVMEGASRPTHFRGVTTIVAKLFNICLPDVAVFGAKDFQQSAVIKRMASDLNFPLKVVVSPTVRESDGLAMSSRNKYLDPEQRRQAIALSQLLHLAHKKVSKTPVAAKQLLTVLESKLKQWPLARLDYISFFDPFTLQPVTRVAPGTQMALAIYFGKTRLIDNALL
jgi:pantoate--beta-alanine ligase